MKLLRKKNKLLMGGTISCAVILSGLLTNQPYVAPTVAAQIAQALSPEEVNLRAKQIIVRIDGASVGTGSLIEHSKDTYTVLTNWHVMKNQGEYIVSTIDGRKHQVNQASIKQLPGLDLAIFQFTSNQNYQIAELGNSDNLNEGQSIYFAGYPGELRREDNRYYRFFPANIVGILPKSTENGYSLIYNGEAFPGMSGGPVFNQNGLVIGVHGEANVHALSGGTSNYAIPINTYQTAIANLNQQPADKTPSVPAEEAPTPSTNDVASESTTEPETPPETKPPKAENQPTESQPSTTNSPDVSSVPTFTPDLPAKSVNTQDNNAIAQEPKTSEVTEQSEENVTEENNSTPESQSETEATEPKTTEVSSNNNNRKISLVSNKTGIDYTSLQNLLKEEKWSEADLQTYKMVEKIVKTAKQKNNHIFIELKTIAEFACPDIRTIDSLWKKHTGNKFGFSSQQEVWQSVNQKGDFSTQTWRQFATQVGWKKGDVASGSGYLLYEQLDFNPTEAPTGHLPWWFALPDEEQKVIKHLFARCNFNPTPQELAAEEGKDKPKKPRQNNTENIEQVGDSNPTIEKAPK